MLANKQKANPAPIKISHAYKFADINPIYATKQVLRKLPTMFLFENKTRPKEVAIICPNKQHPQSLYTIVYNSMAYHKKTYLEWFMDISERRFDYTTKIYGPTYIDCMNYIFTYNQQLRWKFKQIACLWLLQKSKKKIIGKEDIVTRELIKPEDEIQVICLKSRCVYLFSGNTLLKSICSNLETQSASLAIVVAPKNPFTNMAFSYGQTLHMYSECLSWCAKRCKPFPVVFAMYKDSNFQMHRMAKMHNIYLQYKAIHNYTSNDDVDSKYFLETLSDIVSDHKTFLNIHNIGYKYMRTILFANWIKRSPSHPLLKQWCKFVSDYTFYAQTGIFPRELWLNKIHVLQDLRSLYQASLSNLIVGNPQSS